MNHPTSKHMHLAEPHRTCTSLNVQPVQRHATLPLEPRPMYPFFLRVLSMGGSLIFELDVDSRPCILMHLWKRRREKEHLRNTCPSNLDCVSLLDCISLLKLCGIYFGKVQASTRQSQTKDRVEHLRLRPKIQKPTWKVCLI